MAYNQPDQDQYTLDALYVFPRHTRATFLAATGQQAPAFAVDKPIKRWQLPASLAAGRDPNDSYSFKAVDPQTGQYVTRSISYGDAGKVNLPGAVDYAKYVVAPTGAQAVQQTATGVATGAVNADYLSNFADAQILAAELQTPAPFQPVYPSASISYPPDELRRDWAITLRSGRVANVGVLLKDRNKAGVGAPGHWSDVNNPQWIADVQMSVEANNLPEIPMPSRDLYLNEVIVQVAFLGYAVQRTDWALYAKVADSDAMPGRIRDMWNATVGKGAPSISDLTK